MPSSHSENCFPSEIYQQKFYEDFLQEASEQLAERDEDDMQLLALSLRLKVPIWSNDRHFQHSAAEIYSTAKLLKIVKA